MEWTVPEHPEFIRERIGLPEAVSDKLDAHILLIRQFGPHLGRPAVDTLKASIHSNMKELRFKLGGVSPSRSTPKEMPLFFSEGIRRAKTRKVFIRSWCVLPIKGSAIGLKPKMSNGDPHDTIEKI